MVITQGREKDISEFSSVLQAVITRGRERERREVSAALKASINRAKIEREMSVFSSATG